MVVAEPVRPGDVAGLAEEVAGREYLAAAVRRVAFGVATPSAIERITGTRVTEDDFESELVGGLEQFVDCRWPLLYLTGSASGPATG